MKIKKSGIILLLIAMTIIAAVSALPPSPSGLWASGFWGTLKINGNPAPAGTVISAWINNVPYPPDTTVYDASNGAYTTLSVNGDDPDTNETEGGKDGDIVTFKVSLSGKRYIADQSRVWYSGMTQRLDLTVTPISGTITLKKGWNLISLPSDPV